MRILDRAFDALTAKDADEIPLPTEDDLKAMVGDTPPLQGEVGDDRKMDPKR